MFASARQSSILSFILHPAFFINDLHEDVIFIIAIDADDLLSTDDLLFFVSKIFEKRYE